MSYIDVRKLFGDSIPGPLIKPLSHWMAIDWLNEFTVRAEESYVEGESKFTHILNELDVDYQFLAGDISLIPEEGPSIVVANHPFGFMDALMICDIITKARPDSKVIANYLLKAIPHLDPFIFPVDPFGTKEAIKKNTIAIRQAVLHLKQGGLLAVFPAGEVASYQMSKLSIIEKEWSDLAANLATKTGAPVVPIHFQGRNSLPFHAAGVIHPLLRTVQLLREMRSQQGRTFPVRIGRPIKADELPKQLKTDPKFLMNHIERVGKINPETQRWQRGRDGRIRPPEELEKIIDPVPEPDLVKEVEGFPEDKCIVTSGPWRVFLVEAELIPNCLREIGRLREETFRGVGEGTGREVDLDKYDEYYLHLFLWNVDTHQICGAYRFGLSEDILPKYGPEGFYTHSLFNYNPKFFDQIGPICEKGRSFVVASQQRSFSSLALLWKGIGAFLIRYPQYRYGFGPVSISSNYQMLSKELIVKFLDRFHKSKHYSKMVSSLQPPEETFPGFQSKSDLSDNLDTIRKVSGAVSAIEEDGKGIPVLFRQYLKFETTFLGFNVDDDFSGCIDGLILVDWAKTNPSVGNKLLGKNVVETLREYHSLPM